MNNYSLVPSETEGRQIGIGTIIMLINAITNILTALGNLPAFFAMLIPILLLFVGFALLSLLQSAKQLKATLATAALALKNNNPAGSQAVVQHGWQHHDHKHHHYVHIHHQAAAAVTPKYWEWDMSQYGGQAPWHWSPKPSHADYEHDHKADFKAGLKAKLKGKKAKFKSALAAKFKPLWDWHSDSVPATGTGWDRDGTKKMGHYSGRNGKVGQIKRDADGKRASWLNRKDPKHGKIWAFPDPLNDITQDWGMGDDAAGLDYG